MTESAGRWSTMRWRGSSAARRIVVAGAAAAVAAGAWACDRASSPVVRTAPAHSAVPSGPAASASVTATAVVEGPLPKLDFAMAKPQRSRQPLPARFHAALPLSWEQREARPETFPPEAYVSARLCAGDEHMQQRLLASWRAAAKKNLPLAGYSVGEPGCESFCRWSIGVAKADQEPTAVRQLAVSTLAGCREPRTDIAAVMSLAVAPADAIESWLLRLSFEGLEVGYLPSMRRVLEAGKTKQRAAYGQRLAAVAVGHAVDPKVAELLLDYHAALTDPVLKNAVAFGMRWQTDPRARKVFLAACRTTKDSEPLCPKPGAVVDDSLDAKVREPDFDARRFVRKHSARNKEVRQALERCIAQAPWAGEQTEAFRAAWCVEKLARFDWKAARHAAGGASAEAQEKLREVAVSLSRFDSSQAMVAELQRLGFPLDKPPADSPPAISVIEALVQGGRAHHFDTETGTFPNYHDELLARLAFLSEKALAGAVFEEIPPKQIDSSEPYELRAYLDGTQYSLSAENHGDWYDVEAVLGLLNALLVDRKSAWRYAVVGTGGQDIYVVAAPEKALARVARDGLLVLSEGAEAVEAGKAFERKALEMLRKQRP